MTTAIEFSPRQVDLIRRLIAPGVDHANLLLFLEVCRHYGLSPFARQIFPVVRYDRQAGGKRLTVVVSIDGLRVLAERTGQYRGQVGPLWCGADGQWQEVWLKEEPPAAAKVGVLREQYADPIWGVALYREYAQTDGGKPLGLWAKMPASMLAKCAEALALRRAFPAVLSGLYAQQELHQAADSAMAVEAIAEEEAEPEAEPLASREDLQRVYERAVAAGLCQDKRQFVLLCRQVQPEIDMMHLPLSMLAHIERELFGGMEGEGEKPSAADATADL
ncbi:MAG: phage recombination protein Bet [Acidobacterium ailaaui]|jgi:phage recombination protein Bet|nr:phage recombination protein Bet [Pseudacidobacterium ailaaui]